jgi:hypothetical protein
MADIEGTTQTDVPPDPVVPKVVMARLNCQIPTATDERLRAACEIRMIGVGLVVDRAINKFLDELPPPL